MQLWENLLNHSGQKGARSGRYASKKLHEKEAQKCKRNKIMNWFFGMEQIGSGIDKKSYTKCSLFCPWQWLVRDEYSWRSSRNSKACSSYMSTSFQDIGFGLQVCIWYGRKRELKIHRSFIWKFCRTELNSISHCGTLAKFLVLDGKQHGQREKNWLEGKGTERHLYYTNHIQISWSWQGRAWDLSEAK